MAQDGEADKNLDIAIFVFVLSTTKDILDCRGARQKNKLPLEILTHREQQGRKLGWLQQARFDIVETRTTHLKVFCSAKIKMNNRGQL